MPINFSFNNKKEILNLAILIIIVISVPIAVFLVQRTNIFRLSAAPQVTLHFEPLSSELPPDQPFSLLADSGSNQVGFIAAQLNFDPSLVQISDSVSPSSALTRVVKITPTNEANQTGLLDIVLALEPGESPPSGLFEFASMVFTPVTQNTTSVTLSYNLNSSQVVDMNAQELIADQQNATLVLNTPQANPVAEIKLVPDRTELPLNSITLVKLMMKTSGESMSSLSARFTVDYDSNNSEIEIVDQNGVGIAELDTNDELLLTGDWSFPINTITKTSGSTTVELSAINTNFTGYSNTEFVELASFYVSANDLTTSPIEFKFDLNETQILSKSEPVQNILADPLSMFLTVYEPTPSLDALRFRLQGVSIPGVSKNMDLEMVQISDGNTHPFSLRANSEVAGTFQNQSEIKLLSLPNDGNTYSYNVFVKAPGWLRKNLGYMQIKTGLNIAPSEWANQELIAGDFNDDNRINITDIALILSQYTQLNVPVNSENVLYDLDASGNISINDIAIILSNYTALNISGD